LLREGGRMVNTATMFIVVAIILIITALGGLVVTLQDNTLLFRYSLSVGSILALLWLLVGVVANLFRLQR
jgi:hypothetical protein